MVVTPPTAVGVEELRRQRAELAIEVGRRRELARVGEKQSPPAIRELLSLLEAADDLVTTDRDMASAVATAELAKLKAERGRITRPLAVGVAAGGGVLVALGLTGVLSGWVLLLAVLLLGTAALIYTGQVRGEVGADPTVAAVAAALAAVGFVGAFGWPVGWLWIAAFPAAMAGALTLLIAIDPQREDGAGE